jgi:hypothetical protein
MDELKILEEQPTQEKPFIVDNYPYGYTQRTQIRYWVETTGRGQRFISQTLNPKTGVWNKPKKTTYSNIVLIGLNGQGHITYNSLTMYCSKEAQDFKTKYWELLSEYQKNELTNILKMLEVLDKVEYKIVTRKWRNLLTGEIVEAVPLMQLNEYEEVKEENGILVPVDREKEEKKQNEINRDINRTAILNASTETGIKSAIGTFKRRR